MTKFESLFHTNNKTPDMPEFEQKNSNQELSPALKEFYDLSKSKLENKYGNKLTSLEMKNIMDAMGLSTKAVLLATNRETTI